MKQHAVKKHGREEVRFHAFLTSAVDGVVSFDSCPLPTLRKFNYQGKSSWKSLDRKLLWRLIRRDKNSSTIPEVESRTSTAQSLPRLICSGSTTQWFSIFQSSHLHCFWCVTFSTTCFCLRLDPMRRDFASKDDDTQAVGKFPVFLLAYCFITTFRTANQTDPF